MAALGKAKALYPYAPTAEDELALQEGDVVIVLDKFDDGWWRGEVRGQVGANSCQESPTVGTARLLVAPAPLLRP